MAINKSLDRSLTNLDRVLKLIDPPDILTPDEQCKHWRVTHAIIRLISKIYVRLARVANLIGGDHQWYNEAKARKIVKHYIWNAQTADRNDARTQKVELIYDKLVRIRKGHVTYADRIEKGWIKECAKPDTEASDVAFVRYKDMPQVKARMLFHLQADEFGSNSTLEGHQTIHPLKFTLEYLRKRQKDPNCQGTISDALLKQIQDAVALAGSKTYVPTAKEQLQKALKEGSRILIPGGWIGKPGHAMYYEVIAETPQTATFRIFNTGAGVGYHNPAIVGNKEKYQPYIEWKGVSADKLMNDNFWKAIQEFNTIMSYKVDSKEYPTNFNAEDIYKGLKELLEPKEESSVPPTDGSTDKFFMSSQRSGVCAERSLLAFLRTRVEYNEYKRFKCGIRLQTLVDKVRKTKNQTPFWVKLADRMSPMIAEIAREYFDIPFDPMIERKLIEKSRNKLALTVERMYRDKIIGKKFMTKAYSELGKISDHIAETKALRAKVEPLGVRWGYKRVDGQVQGQYFPTPKYDLHKQMQGLKTDLPVQPYAFLTQKLTDFNFEDANTIGSSLELVSLLAQQGWLAGDDMALHTGVIDVIKKLSLDPEFWKKACHQDPVKAKKMISVFGDISRTYFKNCHKAQSAEVIFPERVYALLKIQYIQGQLVSSVDEQLGKNISFNIDVFNSHLNTSELFLRIPDVNIHNEILTIKKYFGDYKKSVVVNNQTSYQNHEKKYQSYFSKKSENIKTTFFPEEVLRIEPGLEAKMSAQDSAFPTRPVHQRNARIMASSALPDWAKAMRDSNLAFQYLTSGPIANPGLVDRLIDFDFTFKIKDYEGLSTIEIDRTGKKNEILSNSDVDKFLRNSHLRFKGIHRPMAAPAIQNFVDYLLKLSWDNSEKKLLADHVKNHQISLPDEEFKELAHLFSNHEVRLLETLEYFTKHPQKLKDPDYQVLFVMAVFDMGSLEKAKGIKGLDKKVGEFLKSHYDRLQGENEIQGAVFLLQTMRRFEGFFPQQDLFKHSMGRLYQLLDRPGLEPEEKSVIYLEIISHLSEKSALSEDELSDLLIAHSYLSDNPLPNKWKDPQAENVAAMAFHRHSTALQGLLLKDGSPNQQLLNQLVKTLRSTEANHKWNVETKPGQFPEFATDDLEHQFFPLFGRLVSKNAQVSLPLDIRQHPHFKALFPNVKRALPKLGNLFYFKDSKGKDTLVQLDKDMLLVEQRKGDAPDTWCRFIPSDAFIQKNKHSDTLWEAVLALILKIWMPNSKLPEKGEYVSSALMSRYLTHHYSHWQSLKDPSKLYLFDKNGDLECEAKYKNKKVVEVKNLKESSILGKPSKCFSRFEDESYVHEWYSPKGKLQKAELPRFGLSFSPTHHKPLRLFCDQFPGYFVKSDEVLPELGSYRHYIVLENNQGQRKVLLPKQQFTKNERGAETLMPTYQINLELREEDRNPQTYCMLDVRADGKLESKSIEANLYVALALTLVHEYQHAAHYLKKFGFKLTAYTKQESKILEDLIALQQVNGDADGNAAALKAYAAFLLAKNCNDHHVPLNDLEIVRKAYNSYLNHYRQSAVLKLSPEEEYFLIKYITEDKAHPLHILRLKEINPSEVLPQNSKKKAELVLPSPDKNMKGKLFQGFRLNVDGDKEPSHDFKNTVFKTMLISRPYEFITKHINDVYNLAKNGGLDDKKKLRDALTFLSSSQKAQEKNIALFLECVLDHPEQFKDIPVKNKDYKVLYWWEEEVLNKAKALIAQKNPTPEAPKPDKVVPDLTPKDFKLNYPEPVPEAIHVSFNLKPMAALANKTADKNCFAVSQKEDPSAKEDSLNSWLKTFNSSDPVEQKEFDRLKKDLKFHQNKPAPAVYELTNDGLKNIKILLDESLKDNQAQIKSLEKEILALANRAPSFHIGLAQQALLKWGGLRKDLTLDEVLVSFARQDSAALMRKNPALVKEDLNALYAKVGDYLLLATYEQQRNRAKASLDKLESLRKGGKFDPQDERDLVQQLASDMLAKRCFDPQNEPSYLVFEYYAGILIREVQKQKLKAFLEGGDSNPVMEMIMGSGKSKVLLPLLGLLRAKGDTLSMLIVPQPLFESISSDTQNILREAFGQSLRSLHFDRNTTFTLETLSVIRNDLKCIIKNKECLIMTSKSVQCLMLKYIELFERQYKIAQEGGKEDLSQEIQLMREILGLLSQNGYPIIDEADSVLNVLHEVCFSLGSRTNPIQENIKVISEIYDILFTDEALKELGKLECDPNPHSQAPALTDKIYAKTYKQLLAERFMDRLKTICFESKPFMLKVNIFATALSVPDRKRLVNYLCRDGDLDDAQDFYNNLDKELKDIIALAGEEISHLLEHTLTRNCDEKYGLDHEMDGLLAIPFAAANTPNRGSQFANPYITMNYTFQYYLKKGISHQILVRAIEKLQKSALQELREGGRGAMLKNTKAWKIFSELKGDLDMPLFNFKDVHLDKLGQKINSNLATKRAFISLAIIPQMDLFENKLSCNPHNLASFFEKVSGFTGTLWNGASMHGKLTPQPEEGTDAKTLSLLWNKSREAVFTLNEGPTSTMLDQLKSTLDYDVIIDAGGYFKEGGNLPIAREMAKKHGKSVVFYNQKGEQSITDGKTEMPLSLSPKTEDERLTFLDQSHTTGADVKQKRNAVGVVSIGRNILLRDLLQSAWRLRGLDKSQKVAFVMSQEVQSIIRNQLNLPLDKKIVFDDILRFAILNQARQQGRDNFKAFRQELWNIPQKILLDALLSKKLGKDDVNKAYEHLRSTWIKPACKPTGELYGTLMREKENVAIMTDESQRCIDFIQKLFHAVPALGNLGFSPESVIKEVHAVADHMKGSLPKTLKVKGKGEDNEDDDQTVEIEQQTQTETELEQQELQYTEKVELGKINSRKLTPVTEITEDQLFKAYKKYDPSNFGINTNGLPVLQLDQYMQQDMELKPYSEAFKGIELTLNVLEWPAKNPQIGDLQLLGPHRTPIHFLRILDDKVTILSQLDAAHAADLKDANDKKSKAQFYNLTLGFIGSNAVLTDEAKKKVVKIKFLDGESSFTKEEIKILKEWFQEQGASKMRKLYFEYITSGYPIKAEAYKDSSLHDLFTEMCTA